MKSLGHTVNQASIHFLRLSCFLSFWSLWKSPTRTPKGALPMFSGGWGYVAFSSTGSAWRLGDGAGVGCIISVANNLICSLYFFTSSLEAELRSIDLFNVEWDNAMTRNHRESVTVFFVLVYIHGSARFLDFIFMSSSSNRNVSHKTAPSFWPYLFVAMTDHPNPLAFHQTKSSHDPKMIGLWKVGRTLGKGFSGTLKGYILQIFCLN